MSKLLTKQSIIRNYILIIETFVFSSVSFLRIFTVPNYYYCDRYLKILSHPTSPVTAFYLPRFAFEIKDLVPSLCGHSQMSRSGLNVVPTVSGVLPPASSQTFLKVGAEMKAETACMDVRHHGPNNYKDTKP
jgi:hypothetical protein